MEKVAALAAALIGLLAGVVMSALLSNALDDRRICDGFMEHRSTAYTIRPAKVTEITP